MIMKKITWKLNSDDDLPLNKPLNVYLMTITIRSIFKENGKVYPHVFLDDTGHFSGQLLQENDLSSLLLKWLLWSRFWRYNVINSRCWIFSYIPLLVCLQLLSNYIDTSNRKNFNFSVTLISNTVMWNLLQTWCFMFLFFENISSQNCSKSLSPVGGLQIALNMKLLAFLLEISMESDL